jgi:hypothetical protein
MKSFDHSIYLGRSTARYTHVRHVPVPVLLLLRVLYKKQFSINARLNGQRDSRHFRRLLLNSAHGTHPSLRANSNAWRRPRRDPQPYVRVVRRPAVNPRSRRGAPPLRPCVLRVPTALPPPRTLTHHGPRLNHATAAWATGPASHTTKTGTKSFTDDSNIIDHASKGNGCPHAASDRQVAPPLPSTEPHQSARSLTLAPLLSSAHT